MASEGIWILTFKRNIVLSFSRVCMSLMTKTLYSFEISVSGNPMMQHHVPEELNHVQVYRFITYCHF